VQGASIAAPRGAAARMRSPRTQGVSPATRSSTPATPTLTLTVHPTP